MIEEFSGGYHRTIMDVQEYSDGPVIQTGLYDFINRTVYVDSDAPVTMLVTLDASEHFTVGVESAIPRDVLALPQRLIDEVGKTSVFIMKPDYAETIGKHYG